MILNNNQVNNKWVLVCFISLLLINPACIDPISFKAETSDRLLVIDGLFSASRQHLRLSYTRDFTTSGEDDVSDAEISLFDTSGHIADYVPVGEGAYEIQNQELKPEEGKAYYIKINLANGKKYQTHPQIIPKGITPKALKWTIEKEIVSNQINATAENFFIKLYIDTELSIDKEPAYLRWLTDEVYSFQDEICHQLDFAISCYVYLQPKQEIVILSGEDLSEGVIENIPVYAKRLFPKTPEYEQKHAFNMYQLSITSEAFTYWENVLQLSNQTGSIFDRPPAGLRGNGFNVEEEEELVLGFFEVAAIDTIRIFTRPSDFQGKYEFINYCSNVFPDRFTRDCCDCLLIEGSTLEAPAYW